MTQRAYRAAIEDYIRTQANPPDKLSHQPRVYRLACHLAGHEMYDDDALHAAAWLHDLGVFIGHRPQEPAALAAWDHVAYAMKGVPGLLRRFGFPIEKINSVVEVIRTHLPRGVPTCFEGSLLRDADILEQLGAAGVLRIVSKVGRDTRFVRLGDTLRVLRTNLETLPAQLQLPSARALAEPRLRVLRDFLAAAETEADSAEW